MIPSPPPPSLAFSSPASAGAVRGMATRADGFPQTAAAAPRVDLNRGGMQSTPSARTTIRRTLRPRGVQSALSTQQLLIAPIAISEQLALSSIPLLFATCQSHVCATSSVTSPRSSSSGVSGSSGNGRRTGTMIHRGEIQRYSGSRRGTDGGDGGKDALRQDSEGEQRQLSNRIVIFLGDQEAACTDAKRVSAPCPEAHPSTPV